jgi:hypothetical protein
MVHVARDPSSTDGIPLIFEKQWKDRIEILQADRKITALGKIRRIEATILMLEQCELV